LKKKTKIRDSHRAFVRKIISEAKESLDGVGSVDFKKLKSFRSTLQDKVLELKGMDQDTGKFLQFPHWEYNGKFSHYQEITGTRFSTIGKGMVKFWVTFSNCWIQFGK